MFCGRKMISRRKVGWGFILVNPLRLGFYSSRFLVSPALKIFAREISSTLLKISHHKEGKVHKEQAFDQHRLVFALLVYPKSCFFANGTLTNHFTTASNCEVAELGFGDGKQKNKVKMDEDQMMNSNLQGNKINASLHPDRPAVNNAALLKRIFMIDPINPKPNSNPNPSIATNDTDVVERKFKINTNPKYDFKANSASNIAELGFGKMGEDHLVNSDISNSHGSKLCGGLCSDRTTPSNVAVLKRIFKPNPYNPSAKPKPTPKLTANNLELGVGKINKSQLMNSGIAGSDNNELDRCSTPDLQAANIAAMHKRKFMPKSKPGPNSAANIAEVGFGKMGEGQGMNSGVANSDNNKLDGNLSPDCPTTNNTSALRRIFKSKPRPNPNPNPKPRPNPNPNSDPNPNRHPNPAVNDSARILRLFKMIPDNPNTNLERVLNEHGFVVSENLALHVLSGLKNDWNSAMFFFTWAAKQPSYSHGTEAYNAMLNVLGRFKRFITMWRLVFEMHKCRPSLVTDETFSILIRRYASAHMVERAMETFYRRPEFGLKLNKPAFQVLLDALCKARHVQEAEALLNLKQKECTPDMKSRNIILNGWCGFPNLREAKRFWRELNKQGCKPNLITYSIFISALAKKSKLNTALTLFDQMWNQGCIPDVPLCNAILDAICLKKGISTALDVFSEMNERGCLPDVATYNTLIKHICDARSVHKAYDLLDEMERRGCAPNVRTYHYFLRVAEMPQEALKVFQRMVKTGCMPTSDTYNLMLKMLLGWNEMDRVLVLWDDMQKLGMGPDQRSYTVMVHGLHEKGKFDEAYEYYNEMRAKGLLPEPKTNLLGNAIEINAKQRKFGGM